MDVATITMPVDEARAKYEKYRAGLEGREPTDEDKGVLIGYKALASGKAVLNLRDVFTRCPPDRSGKLPGVAAARAHWRWCHLRRDAATDSTSGRFCFGDSERIRTNEKAAWHRRIWFSSGTLHRDVRPAPGVWNDHHRALVPLIPPNLRPARALERYVILFEAEWEPVPPTDPMLLRHLHGDLYAVLATWDLTPLERAVLSGRFSERT